MFFTIATSPITLLLVPVKVFAQILLGRLDPLLRRTRRSQQYAPSPRIDPRCISHPGNSLIYMRVPLHVAYVNLKAAFDSFDRLAPWKALQVVDLIRSLHEGSSSRVRYAGKLSALFHTTSEVRQGCILAPALFCRAMDIIMGHVAEAAAGL